MTEKEKRILETISRIIPQMTEAEKSHLLGFGEGIEFIKAMAQNTGTNPKPA